MLPDVEVLTPNKPLDPWSSSQTHQMDGWNGWIEMDLALSTVPTYKILYKKYIVGFSQSSQLSKPLVNTVHSCRLFVHLWYSNKAVQCVYSRYLGALWVAVDKSKLWCVILTLYYNQQHVNTSQGRHVCWDNDFLHYAMLNKLSVKYLEKERLPLFLQDSSRFVTGVKQCLQFLQAGWRFSPIRSRIICQ